MIEIEVIYLFAVSPTHQEIREDTHGADLIIVQCFMELTILCTIN